MSNDFDCYARNYDAVLEKSLGRLGGGDVDYFRQRKAEIVARLLGQAKVTSILEYGCGTGGNLPFLARQFPGARLAGCDVSEKSLQVAAASFPEASLSVVGRDPLPRAAFDLLFVSNVLHHVPPGERSRLFAGLAPSLAPGGALAVFEHNPANPLTRRVVARCPFDAGAVLLPPAEVAALARGAGLTVSRRRYTLFFPPSLAFFAPLEAGLGWLPLGAQYVVLARRAPAPS